MYMMYKNKIDVPRLNNNSLNMQGRHNRHKSKPLNFDAYAGQGNHFIYEVARELGSSRDHAARVTRAVLHALRDRLPADEAIQFCQALPMALKGVYIDQYDLSQAPVLIRNPKHFINFVKTKAGVSSPADFPDPDSVREALRAVFYVLERHVSPGQMHQMKHALNQEILDMVEDDRIFDFF
jgi:uncharacterized protein (DUF2267 family)